MFLNFKTLLITTVFVVSVSAPSSATNLNGAEVKELVEGKRVFLKIPLGGEFPLRYKANGVVQGDGTAAGVGRFFAPKDEGVWWIKDNKLCQKWAEWYRGKTACFVISDVDGKGFRWLRDDGRKGRGRVE